MKTFQFFFIAASCISNATASDEDPSPRIANQPRAPPQVSVSKCCPEQQSLDMSNPKHPVCKEDGNVSSPFIAMRGLNMDDNFINGTKEVEIQLTQDQETPHSMPPCFTDFEVHRILHSVTDNVRDTWITVEGKLVTSRYEAEFDHGDFCIDREMETGGILAVMCDACKRGVPCINLCCPHGYAFIDNPDYDYDDVYDYDTPPKICKKKEDGLNYNPTLWDHNDKVFLENWEKNRDFLLVGPKLIPENASISHFFECPKDAEKKETGGITFAPTDLGTFHILINGKLQGKDITNTITKEKTTKVWNSDNYCAIFAIPPDYSTETGNDTSSAISESNQLQVTDFFADFEFTYMVCHEEKNSWCENFTSIFHPIMLSISTIFLIITVLVYVFEDTLKKTNPLFSKITIGFISNLIICFIVLIDNYFKQLEGERRETVPCILSGYLVMYFFLAFFFWINTMSFNIWLKFTLMSMRSPSRDEANKTFMKYFLYAQGMPLLITVITAIVDASAPRDGNAENFLHYPNMGMYSCFLGAVKTPEVQSYFGRPEFLYFQVFIMILQIANMIFLGVTINTLLKGWKNQAQLLKESGKDKEHDVRAQFKKMKDQLGVVVRLFVIMGVPWILELISSGISAEHGFDETCWLRLGLDMSNLLAGILIFLVIVAKKPVMMNLKAKAGELTSSIYPGQGNSSAGMTRVTDIEMKSVSGSDNSN